MAHPGIRSSSTGIRFRFEGPNPLASILASSSRASPGISNSAGPWDMFIVSRIGFKGDHIREYFVQSFVRANQRQRIESTRERVREVFEKYFKTHQGRLHAMLRSAAIWKQNWQRNEKESLRLLADAYHAKAADVLHHLPGGHT